MKSALQATQSNTPNPGKNGSPLIIAIIPDIAKELKDRIKFLGDISLGIPTRCFVPFLSIFSTLLLPQFQCITKFRRGQDQYLHLAS